MNLEGSEIDWNAVMEFRKDNEHQKLYSYDIETTEKTLIWEGTMENVLLRGEAYMISDEYNGTGIRYILMDGKLTVPAHKEKLSEKISNPGITGIYFYKGEVFLVCDGKIEIYDIESGEINEPESQGKNEGLMRVDAIVGERVHLLRIITFVSFQKSRILDVNDIALFIQNHQHRETETRRISQHRHGFGILIILGIVDVDIDKTFANHLVYSSIFSDKICKTQTPRTPVGKRPSD